MPKPQITGTEFDSFFINKAEIKEEKKEILQKDSKTEKQNTEIPEEQKTIKPENHKAINMDTLPVKQTQSRKKKLPKRDDPEYMRVTVAIHKKTLKSIKDYMWENGIKNFDDALELFLSKKPLK